MVLYYFLFKLQLADCKIHNAVFSASGLVFWPVVVVETELRFLSYDLFELNL
jgi:hypothetical protein